MVKTRQWLTIAGVLSLITLGACQSGGPVRTITRGDELASYDFSAPGGFEEGAYGAATLRVTGGAYRIDVLTGDNTLWWGQWGDTYSDVIIDVDVEQITERNENAYGVMCRVRGSVGQPRTLQPEMAAILTDTPTEIAPSLEDMTAEMTSEAAADMATMEMATAEMAMGERPTAEGDAEATAEVTEAADGTPALTEVPTYGEGDGYLFLIQGTGAYGIFRARGRDVTPLVNWTTSDRINVGPASNHLRAVCVGNYLALYINDTFVADATDDTYTSGQIGLLASAANRLGIRVDFDNLSIAAPAS